MNEYIRTRLSEYIIHITKKIVFEEVEIAQMQTLARKVVEMVVAEKL